ncbi:MAG: NADP(H)-dependent aldo-keto reductase [Alphaproteobacteria bacterium]|nr:NADP(H)-dependent aldo-keto reductase [Alphaproteobacteria bacterium]
MKMNPLGRTGITVSRICLGTMTFGQQNTEEDAHRQLDMALDHGVNFIDTAEAYSFPGRPETQGRSEEIIGTWMQARGNRDKVVIATKITGPSNERSHIRNGKLDFSREQVTAAVDLSLKRLKTDVIDLYQTHWPERKANYFGKLDYVHAGIQDFTPMEEQIDALGEQVKAGKVRAIGVSNETAWGVMKFLEIAERTGLPRLASIQNPYNLICRQFDIGLAEPAMREDVGLLAYSPLAFGALTGKYLDGQLPEGSRHKLFPQFKRYFKPNGVKAVEAYVALARVHGLEPSQMALAFVHSRPFLTSTIIGATTEEQLKSNLETEDMTLPEDVLERIEAIHADNPNPGP